MVVSRMAKESRARKYREAIYMNDYNSNRMYT